MPYSGPDDPDLPENVQDLSQDKREQWVAIFNSSFERCQEEGLSEVADDPSQFDSCEAFAFANANGVVLEKEERMEKPRWMQAWEQLRDLILEFPKSITELRALSGESLFNQLWDGLLERGDWIWVNDIYWDDDGSTFAVVSSEGKLYRVNFTIDGNEVRVSDDWQEVEPEFKPLSRTTTKIIRQKDGRVRWLSISNTAVLNRSGELDARELFDSFIQHAQETGEHPYRTFYHQGKEMKTGDTDFMARDGYCYITSGLYEEDNPLAEHEIKALEREPEYWGESIGFEVSDFENMEVAEGVTIPVFTKGIHRETSTLPSDRACALFTRTFATKEVARMKPDVKEALTRLTDGDEELIEQFDEVLNETNRTIEEENLVRREEEVEPEAEAEPVEEEVEAEEEEAEEEAEPVAEVEEEEPEVVEQAFPEIGELELDDEVVERIAETALQSEHIISEFELRDGDIAELKKGIEELQAIVRGLQDLPKRVTALELSDDEKRQVWLEDQPKKAEKITVTYRPREDPEKESEEEESMASKAEDTLEKMPTYK